MVLPKINRLECTCIGARSKIVLKQIIEKESNCLSNDIKYMKEHKTTISESDWEDKHILLSDIEKRINTALDDKQYMETLFDKISKVKICGD